MNKSGGNGFTIYEVVCFPPGNFTMVIKKDSAGIVNVVVLYLGVDGQVIFEVKKTYINSMFQK